MQGSATQALMTTYNPLPIAFERGEGVYLYDTDGKRYLDGLAGIAVNCLGHAHPALVEAIRDQAGKVLHTANVYTIPYQIECARKLVELSGMDNVFFSSTGAEANECAIKLARMYGHEVKNIDEPAIIVMEKAFHGRTMATLTASGSRRVQAGFEPLVQGFVRAPYNDLEAIENIAKHNHNIVAILVEPTQGEGGLFVPDDNYLPGLRKICDEHGWLLMLDEVQSGIGRTGKMFAFEHHNIKPDVVTLAKALGGGIPVAATLASGVAATLFKPGNHGSTFGGNPLSTRAALTVLETIEKDKLLQNVQNVSKYFFEQLREHILPMKHVVDVRGQGLWIGVEMDAPARPLLYAGAEAGILFSVTAEKVLRFAPPLIFQKEHVDEIIVGLKKIIAEFEPA